MKAYTKSILIILATLAVGMLIGGLGGGAITSHRLDQIKSLSYEEGFIQRAEEVIMPESAAQRAEIRPILERAAAERAALRVAYKAQKAALLDSMRAQLGPLLADEQQERLGSWCGRSASLPKAAPADEAAGTPLPVP
jgi:hypothetical protein